MELWIRSQDKMKLVKVNYIYAVEGNDYFTIYGETIDSGPIIAKYKTKERALEVLDEIQALLKQKVLLNSGKILGSFEDTIYREPDKVEIKELNTTVYEIPKE